MLDLVCLKYSESPSRSSSMRRNSASSRMAFSARVSDTSYTVLRRYFRSPKNDCIISPTAAREKQKSTMIDKFSWIRRVNGSEMVAMQSNVPHYRRARVLRASAYMRWLGAARFGLPLWALSREFKRADGSQLSPRRLSIVVFDDVPAPPAVLPVPAGRLVGFLIKRH